MDIFAHFLWTLAVFWDNKKKYWAALLGVAPDLLSFGPFFVVNLFSGAHWNPGSIPAYVYMLYSFTHSIVIWALLFGFVWLVLRKPPYILLAWALHIGIDVFTHTERFFPTPVFWPISDWHYPYGISWGTPAFMIANYSALAIVYIILLKQWLDSNEKAKAVLSKGKGRTKYKKRA